MDFKIASGLNDILHGDFLRRVNLLDEEYQKKGRLMTGRQVAYMIYEHFRMSEVEGAVWQVGDLIHLELMNDNLRAFDTRWAEIIQGMPAVPDDVFLESLYEKQLLKSQQFQPSMMQYRLSVLHEKEKRSYEKLRQLVRVHLADAVRAGHRKVLDNLHLKNGLSLIHI